jgi:hypothetical protein
MRHPGLSAALLLLSMSAVRAFSQTGTSIPSNDEIFELLAKAEQKVSGFENAIKGIKPSLDKADPKLSTMYTNAGAAAHTIILSIRKNGPSAYSLMSLVTTLDDLSLDAATASVQLLLLRIQSGQTAASSLDFLVPLMTSKNECNDISELIMHAPLRYIHAEEDVLEKLSHIK